MALEAQPDHEADLDHEVDHDRINDHDQEDLEAEVTVDQTPVLDPDESLNAVVLLHPKVRP